MEQPAPHKQQGLHYLWHLHQIRLLDKVDSPDGDIRKTKYEPNFAWKPTETGKRISRVAIIDNGCVPHHPNLANDRILSPIEFSRSIAGTLYVDPGCRDEAQPGPGKESILKALELCRLENLAETTESEDGDYGKPGLALREAIRSISSGVWPEIDIETAVQAPAERFSPHGTACAGLVGADARVETDTTKKSHNPWAIDYSGVNPLAKIVPIATVYNQDYWPLIMALLYAISCEADVILMPRAIEEMASPAENADMSDPRYSRLLNDNARYADFLLLKHILRAVSDAIPVVVPAGNNGVGGIEFPAKLSDTEFPNLIVCGAVNHRGLRSAYSSTGSNDIVYAPGDDSQELTREDTRYDEFSWRARRISMLPDQKEGHVNRFGAYGILAIDVPGFYGYTVEGNNLIDFRELRMTRDVDTMDGRADLKQRSLYAIFGGTSAASSIVAGVCSLVQQRAAAKLSGAEMKRVLVDASREPVEAQTEIPFLATNRESASRQGPMDPDTDKVGVLNAVFALALVEKQPSD